jgi:hypothetical protein
MKLKYNIILLLLILLVGIVCMAGCTSSTSAPTATPTPQIVYVTVLVTSTPTPSPTPIQITSPTTRMVYTTDEINKHFIDIAFSNNFQSIMRSDPAARVSFAVTGKFNDNDETILTNTQQQFNEHSTTTQLTAEPSGITHGDILFNFLPGSTLDSIAQTTSFVSTNTSQFIINKDDSGDIASIYRITFKGSSSNGIVYLNSDLTGNEREHYLVRGLLYYLGFVGETGSYPDSIFYSAQNNVTIPNPIDWKIISIMYGNKITSGMTLNNIKNTLLITNS